MNRKGGYTRVTRTEPLNRYDQAEYAILEFVDGPRDSRYMMTAMAVARDRERGVEPNELTRLNIEKVTRYTGKEKFEEMVERLRKRWGKALRASWRDEPAHIAAKR